MKLFKSIKNIFNPDELITAFVLEKKYKKSAKKIAGSIKFLAKKETTITKISFTIKEIIKKPKEPGQKKREEIISSIGKHEMAGPWILDALKEDRVEFEVPISVTKKKKAEKKIYKGDYALMNRAHDQSKQTVFLYEIAAAIKIKGTRKPIDISHSIVIE